MNVIFIYIMFFKINHLLHLLKMNKHVFKNKSIILSTFDIYI